MPRFRPISVGDVDGRSPSTNDSFWLWTRFALPSLTPQPDGRFNVCTRTSPSANVCINLIFGRECSARTNRRAAVCELRNIVYQRRTTSSRQRRGRVLPIGSNGPCWCKLSPCGIRRSHPWRLNLLLVTQSRPTVLLETDGPLLKHGLQQMHDDSCGSRKHAQKPDRDRLRIRSKTFEKAG